MITGRIPIEPYNPINTGIEKAFEFLGLQTRPLEIINIYRFLIEKKKFKELYYLIHLDFKKDPFYGYNEEYLPGTFGSNPTPL